MTPMNLTDEDRQAAADALYAAATAWLQREGALLQRATYGSLIMGVKPCGCALFASAGAVGDLNAATLAAHEGEYRGVDRGWHYVKLLTAAGLSEEEVFLIEQGFEGERGRAYLQRRPGAATVPCWSGCTTTDQENNPFYRLGVRLHDADARLLA